MGVGLGAEGLDLAIPAPPVERLGLGQGPVGLEPQNTESQGPCLILQRREDATPDAMAAGGRRDPHPLDLPASVVLDLQRAAADRSPHEARDKEIAGRRRQFLWRSGDAERRVETALEALREFAEERLQA